MLGGRFKLFTQQKGEGERESLTILRRMQNGGDLGLQGAHSVQPMKPPMVNGCWGGTQELAQAGEVMKTQLKHTVVLAQVTVELLPGTRIGRCPFLSLVPLISNAGRF